jgi:hypothetical protein
VGRESPPAIEGHHASHGKRLRREDQNRRFKLRKTPTP